jgi:hypothetical protein
LTTEIPTITEVLIHIDVDFRHDNLSKPISTPVPTSNLESTIRAHVLSGGLEHVVEDVSDLKIDYLKDGKSVEVQLGIVLKTAPSGSGSGKREKEEMKEMTFMEAVQVAERVKERLLRLWYVKSAVVHLETRGLLGGADEKEKEVKEQMIL